MNFTNQEEIEKIKLSAIAFCEGIIECDYKKIFEVFHPDAKSIVVNSKSNELISLTREHWKESHLAGLCDPDCDSDYEIEQIEFHGTVGFARVKITDKLPEEKVIYTDFLSLLKIKDNWIIVNKIGHGERKKI